MASHKTAPGSQTPGELSTSRAGHVKLPEYGWPNIASAVQAEI
jgi:hypothetical protein